MTTKIKAIKISFTVKVSMTDYMNEYGFETETEAVAAMKQDAKCAFRAQLELLGLLVDENDNS